MPNDVSREALLDGLRYLLVEAEALGPLLERLPPDLLAARPPGLTGLEPSVLEALAGLAARDRGVHGPHLRRMLAEDTPTLDAAEPSEPAELSLPAVLADLVAARTELVAAFEAVGEESWERRGVSPDGATVSVQGLARRIAAEDAETLRALAYRLYDADLRPSSAGESR